MVSVRGRSSEAYAGQIGRREVQVDHAKPLPIRRTPNRGRIGVLSEDSTPGRNFPRRCRFGRGPFDG